MGVEKLPEVDEQFWETEINPLNRKFTKEFLQQGHLSPKTLEQYRSALKQFFKWVYDNAENKPIVELKPRDALRYQNFLIERDLSSSAVKFKRSAVSSLCGYLELYYSDEYPLFRNIYNKKIPNPAKSLRNEKKPLTIDEIDNLITELENRNEWQMVAYLLFSYISGCRRTEASLLKKEVINYKKVDGKNYYVTHQIRSKGKGKEGKNRKFQYDDRVLEALKKWLDVRGEDDCEYMFVYKAKDGTTRKLNPSTFNDWASGIFTEIVGRRVHPHLLRSSRATNLVVHEGKNIEAAQALLGHQSPDTTKIYVVKDSEDDLDSIF